MRAPNLPQSLKSGAPNGPPIGGGAVGNSAGGAMVDGSNHRNVFKNLDVDNGRRHSPNTSDAGLGQGSPAASPVPGSNNLYAPSTPNLSASPHQSRFGHRARNSTDSMSSSAAIYGSGLPAEANQMVRQGLNIGEMINASRNAAGPGAAGNRPPSHDSGDRSAGTDPPNSAKDAKSLRSFWNRKKKQKDDSTFPSPDGESPTSPIVTNKSSSTLGSRAGNASDLSLDRPSSSFATSHESSAGFNTASSSIYGKTISSLSSVAPPRVYILATADYWNYRMVDVTDADSAPELRYLICTNLGLPDAHGAAMFLTDLGQFKHDEQLDDTKLLNSRKFRADNAGTLKVFVQPPNFSVSQAQPSPSYLPYGTAMDRDAYDALNGVSRQRSSSSPPTSRQNSTAVADNANNSNNNINNGNANGFPEGLAMPQDIEAAGSQYRAEVERMSQAYQAKRRQAAQKDNGHASSGSQDGIPYGIVGRNVDFDQPRVSPFEDKNPDKLLPQRRAPAPPGDPSATLIKANSLSKRTGDRMRLSQGSNDGYPSSRRPALPTTNESPQEMSEMGRKRPSLATTSAGGSGSSGGAGGDASQPLGAVANALAGMGRGLGGFGHPSRGVSPNRVASAPLNTGANNNVYTHTEPLRGMFCFLTLPHYP